MRKIGAELAVSVALLSGCTAATEQSSGHTSETPSATSTAPTTPTATPTLTQSPYPTYDQAKAATQQYFNQIVAYDYSQGFDMRSTQLEFVEGNATETCGKDANGKDQIYHASDPQAAYCFTIGKLFVTQAWYGVMNSDSFMPHSDTELPREEVLAAHELGHNKAIILAFKAGGMAAVNAMLADAVYNPVPHELQADCIAGQEVRGIDQNATRIVLELSFQYFRGDEHAQTNVHGTTEQRKAAFVAGFNGDPCIQG